MISTSVSENGQTLFKVRVFLKSKDNPNIRITKQKGGMKSRHEAEREELKLKKECERDLHQLEARGVLWCELLDAWYEHHLKIKVHTGIRTKLNHDDYLNSLKKWFGDYLKRPSTELNAYVVAGIFEKMKSQGMSFGHRKKIKQVLKSVFDYGIQSNLLPTVQRSPTFEVVLKREEEKKPEILNIHEIQKLIENAFEDKHEWRNIWATALLTGMRSGELHGLTWKDIDFDNKMINVNKSYNCRMRSTKSTKAGYWRQVPISSELEKILVEQKKITSEQEYVFERHWEWDKGLQAKVLRRFCYVHGLPSIRFHTLRACFATQMLRSGVEAAKVMKICGWKELKTMQHYVRLAGIEIHGMTESLKIFTDLEKATERMMNGSTA